MRRAIHSSGLLRGLAVVCVALLPAAQAAIFVHLHAVRHTTCPEHGELVETAAASADAPARPNTVSPASASGAERHSHDHCLFACHLRQGAERGAAIAGLSHPQPRLERAAEPPAAPGAGPSRLRVAPKQSPPLA